MPEPTPIEREQSNPHPWRRPVHPNSLANLRPTPENLKPRGEVPVEALREAFKQSGLSKCEVARRMGWTKVIPNISRLNIALGLEVLNNGGKRRKVTYETAVKLCKALGASPIDMGL